MSEINHTPGPWFICGVRQKVDGQEALGISRYDASVWYDPRDGAGTQDALLIAAAPEMYEALPDLSREISETRTSHVISWLENGATVEDAVKELRIHKARIDAALAKARGEA